MSPLNIIQWLLIYLAYFGCSIVSLVVLSFAVLWRLLMGQLVYLLHGWEILDPLETFIGAEDVFGDTSLTQLFAVALEDKIDVSELRKLILENWILPTKSIFEDLKYPELTSALKSCMGFLFWRPVKNFKISDHVFEFDWKNVTVNVKGNKSIVDDIVESLLQRNNWLPNKPLWEIVLVTNVPAAYLIENGDDRVVKGDHGCLYLFRYHHILGDGPSMYKLQLGIIGKLRSSDATATTTRKSRSVKSFLIDNTMLGFSLLKGFLCYPVYLERVRRLSSSSPSTNGRSTQTSAPINLNLLKEIKSREGVNMYSVMLDAVAGGLQPLLKTSTEVLNVGITIVMPGHPDALRNHSSLVVLPLPTGILDQKDRIQKINQEFKWLMDSKLPLFIFYNLSLLATLPTCILSWLRRQNSWLLTNPLYLSNVVGPPHSIDILGSTVLNMRTTSTLGFTIGPECLFILISYNGSVRITVCTKNNSEIWNTDDDDHYHQAGKVIESCLKIVKK